MTACAHHEAEGVSAIAELAHRSPNQKINKKRKNHNSERKKDKRVGSPAIKQMKSESSRTSFSCAMQHNKTTTCFCINIMPAVKNKNKKYRPVPPALTTFFTFHAASGLFLRSSLRAVRGTHSNEAGTACGQQKQNKMRNTSHMTVCSNRPSNKGTARIRIIPGKQQNKQ
ncbi:hypothetical protein TCDM_10478 [Trypanosoma cruzi Dm28c]|uniref:Uncharacterized protein n=1 Tax=Trypanosoma cruzi Dm28c TaxID=1416333 RepID=V5B7B7_TRYCR|nr:hypothetical protein TCDM_10478 [Trypanosoma cruzi Dm28c]